MLIRKSSLQFSPEQTCLDLRYEYVVILSSVGTQVEIEVFYREPVKIKQPLYRRKSAYVLILGRCRKHIINRNAELYKIVHLKPQPSGAAVTAKITS